MIRILQQSNPKIIASQFRTTLSFNTVFFFDYLFSTYDGLDPFYFVTGDSTLLMLPLFIPSFKI